MRECKLWHLTEQAVPNQEQNTNFYFKLVKCLDTKSVGIVAANRKYDGVGALRFLEDQCVGDARIRRFNALRGSQLLKQGANESAIEFLHRCDILKSTLTAVNNYDESTFVVAVVEALTPKFEHLKSILRYNFNHGLITYDALRSEIMSQANLDIQANNLQNNNQRPAVNVTNNIPIRVQERSRGRGRRGNHQNKSRGVNKNYKRGKINKPICQKCYSIYHRTSQCNSRVYCKHCDILGHHSDSCYKQYPHLRPGRGGRGGYRGQSQRGRRGGAGTRSNNTDDSRRQTPTYNNHISAEEDEREGSPQLPRTHSYGTNTNQRA